MDSRRADRNALIAFALIMIFLMPFQAAGIVNWMYDVRFIGDASTGDVTLTFDGPTNDATLVWDDGNDRFQISDTFYNSSFWQGQYKTLDGDTGGTDQAYVNKGGGIGNCTIYFENGLFKSTDCPES